MQVCKRYNDVKYHPQQTIHTTYFRIFVLKAFMAVKLNFYKPLKTNHTICFPE